MATRAQRQAAREAVAVNAIFRSAHGDGRTGRGRDIRGEPRALTTVLVAVDSRVQIEVLVHRQHQRQCAEAVLAQARSVEVRVVHRGDGGREGATSLVGRSKLLGQCPVTGDVVPVVTQTRNHLERQVLVVLLGAIATREQQGQLAAIAHRHQRLEVQLLLGLFAHTLPLIGLLVGERDVATQAIAKVAGLETREYAARILAAASDSQLCASFHGRIKRTELQCATEVVRGGSAQRARALRQGNVADVFRGNGAADVHAVVVGVARVAQRQAVKRVTELRLIETTDGDTRGPLIRTEGVGGLEVHARQLLDGLDGAGARRHLRQIRGGQLRHLACFATAEHDDFSDFGIGCGIGCSLFGGGMSLRRNSSAGEQHGNGKSKWVFMNSETVHVHPLDSSGRLLVTTQPAMHFRNRG